MIKIGFSFGVVFGFEPFALLQTTQIHHDKPETNATSGIGSWCPQSGVCDILCPQDDKQCASNHCALNVQGDCCSWHCVDQQEADIAWMEYQKWRVATNFSCPPPLCRPHDFMKNAKLETELARVGGVAPSAIVTNASVPNHQLFQLSDSYPCNVTVHAKRYAHEMSFEIVDANGDRVCYGSTGFRNGQSHVVQCSCPVKGSLTVRCLDSYGDGWHNGFLEVADHRGSPPYEFCADFLHGRLQTETLPEIDLCKLPVRTAPTLPTIAVEQQPLWHGVSEVAYGVLATGLATWVGMSPIGKAATASRAIAERVFWGSEGGLRVAFGIDSLSTGGAAVNDNQRRMDVAELVNGMMKDSLEDVYKDVNQMQESLQECVMQTFGELRGELSDLEDDLEKEMDERDYKNTLEALIFQSQNRLAVVVDYLGEGQGIRWLSASVSEGLQSCVDIGSLASQISETSISEVVSSIAYVDGWFNTCRMFMLLARALAAESETPFKALYSTDRFIGSKFASFYRAVRLIKPEASSAFRPFELEVLNFLNLAEAESYHAVNSLVFPHRQGGRATPAIVTSSAAVVTYFRDYSLGSDQNWEQTCRFCRKDGERSVHYGCWEEEALSYDRCVSSNGIYYNGSLSVSNEYKCKQYQSYGHYRRGISVNCGGRPQQ